MKTFDTLQFGGTERKLTAWQFAAGSCISRRCNLRPDTFTGRIPGSNIAADPIFPYEAAVIVRTNRESEDGADNTFSGGAIKFQGKRIQNRLQSARNRLNSTYEFQGPWYDLDITQYLQTYKGATFNTQPGEVVLNTAAFPLISTGGLRFISLGDQIQCVLQFVLDCYRAMGLPAPFQYVGRNLAAGAISLDAGAGPPTAQNENTDAAGAPYLQLLNAGTTIDISLFKLFLKSEIIRPMSSAQVIQKLLEWSPRTNMAFDYSTVPPTVFFSNIDNAPNVNLPLLDRRGHSGLAIQRRDDLIPAAIVINYRITTTVDGSSATDVVPDKCGPNGVNNPADPSAGPGVVIQTMDLQGSSTTFATGQLDCEPLACIGGTHAARRTWWASKRGGEMEILADSRVRFQQPDPDDEEGNIVLATSVPGAKIYYASAGVDSAGVAVAAGQEFTAADYAFFTNRLVRGTQHAWMRVGGVPVKSVKVRISAPCTYAQYDCLSASGTPELDETGNLISQHNNADLHFNAELTNGVTDTYRTLASSTEGESYIIGPGGIAQYLFNMLATPQYEGEHVKIEASFSGGVSLLSRANFAGGREEWATMHAQIQEIEEDWHRKQTSVRIGIAKHLSADQLNALLNMGRFRRAWYNPLLKADNSAASSGEIAMPVTAGQANTVHGLKNTQQTATTFYTTPPSGSTPGVIGGQIGLDAKKVQTNLAGSTVTLKDPAIPANVLSPTEILVCDAAGNSYLMQVIGSGMYNKL